jgi:CheY-like chemotaxis protein
LGGRRLAGTAEVRGVTTAAAALSIVRDWRPELVVCDVDLGDPSQNGFDVVSRMREAGYRGKVCVHSNRSDTRSYEAALAAGADAFLPKPMSRIHLLDLLVAAVGAGPTAAATVVVPVEESTRPKIAVVDDDVFMLEAWETALSADAAPVTFASPDEFWKAVEKAPELLAGLTCVVTDYHFDNCAADDGVSFAEAMRQRAPRVPILLSSNASLPRGAERVVHSVIDKAPMSWAKLAAATGLEATSN